MSKDMGHEWCAEFFRKNVSDKVIPAHNHQLLDTEAGPSALPRLSIGGLKRG
jgi:hypothetical protein